MTAPNPTFPPPVRVLINAIHAKSGGGVNYLRNILPGLAADPELEVHLLIHENQRGLLEGLDDRIRPCVRNFPTGFVLSLIWEQIVVPLIAWRLGAQTTFSPANFCPLLARRNVVLLRNALAVGDHEPRWQKRVYWWVLGIMTRMSVAVSCRTIAASDYARQALAGKHAAAVAVIHYGVAAGFSADDSPRGTDLLAVSDIYVQKNFHGLVRALARLREGHPNLRLQIAGRAIDAGYEAELKSLIQELGLAEAVMFLGGVAPTDLVSLYRRCGLFVFPSTAETFGNPLVEAMACGAPIACSNAAAMPEIVGEAAVQFDPLDIDAMVSAIDGLLRDDSKRRALGEKALQRSGEFSWQETAAKTAAILKSAATG